MSRSGIFMILIGALILLLALGGNRFGILGFFLWIVAIGFVWLGIDKMVREGFPGGLTSLGAGILIVLHNFGVLKLNFWQFVFAVVGIWAIQVGLRMMMGERGWDHW